MKAIAACAAAVAVAVPTATASTPRTYSAAAVVAVVNIAAPETGPDFKHDPFRTDFSALAVRRFRWPRLNIAGIIYVYPTREIASLVATLMPQMLLSGGGLKYAVAVRRSNVVLLWLTPRHQPWFLNRVLLGA